MPFETDGLVPNRQVMHDFLASLFSELDGMEGGVFEIAYSDPSNAITRASLFEISPDGFNEAADFAARMKINNGVNCYFAPSIRKPSAHRNRRAKRADVMGACVVWADFDEPGAIEAATQQWRELQLPPHAVVVTGRIPNTRAQAFWRIDEKIEDFKLLDEALAGLHVGLNFHGDPKVVNVDRVMRLPGSISWPKQGKEGRVAELTELHNGSGAPAEPYEIERFQTVFPPRDPVAARKGEDGAPGGLFGETTAVKRAVPDPVTQTREFDTLGRRIDGREEYGMRVICGTIRNLAAKLDRWPTADEVYVEAWPTFARECAPKVARVGEDSAVGLEREGRGSTWFVAKCKTHVRRAHEGAITGLETVDRAKVAVALNSQPDPSILRSAPALNFFGGDFSAARFIGRIAPKVDYLVEGVVPQSRPALLAAIGGLGKSFVALDLCLKVAAGPTFGVPPKWFGRDVTGHGAALFITAEDDENAIHRRLNSITDDEMLGRARERLHILPLPNHGGALPLVAKTPAGPQVTTQMHDLIKQASAVPDLRLIVIDPLQAFCLADVNTEPAVAQALWAAVSQLSAQTGATVIILHHMRKDGLGEVKGLAQARESIRGTSAIVDGARLALVMYPLDGERASKAAKGLSLGATVFGDLVAGGVVKTNDEADKSEHFFQRAESGLLHDRTMEINEAIRHGGSLAKASVDAIFEEVNRAGAEGDGYSVSSRSNRPLWELVVERGDVSEKAAKGYVSDWSKNNLFEIKRTNKRTYIERAVHPMQGV